MPVGVYVRSEEYRKNISESWTDERREKMREANKAMKGPKHPAWKGGQSIYYHNLAWNMFGKTYCEMCSMGLLRHYMKYHMRFHMHCESDDYRILEKENWLTVCYKCHGQLDSGKKTA